MRITKKENAPIEYKTNFSSILFKDSFFVSAIPKKELFRKPVYIVFVSINCEFCHEVMNQINEGDLTLKDNQLILIYLNPMSDVKKYLLQQKISKKDMIYSYSDSNSEIKNTLKKVNTPSVFLLENNSVSLKASGLSQSFNLVNSLK
ncbi:MAG: hypothetical protein ACOYLT_09965 [Flavobacterium sp.]|uniref:hypothetical protein n=1 Tax=Flavobacterium sp. TaxID=239 RepID=UPI003BEB6647